MIKHFKKTLSLLIISGLFIFCCFVLADFNLTDWAFYKEIVFPDQFSNFTKALNPIWVNLDEEVLAHSRYDLADLRVVTGEQEQPFKIIMSESYEVAHGADIIDVSSVRPSFRNQSFGPFNMLDGDQATFFQNDFQKDSVSTFFVIDLQEEFLTNKVVIFSSDPNNTWQEIKIEGSNDTASWQLIKHKTKLAYSAERQVVYPESFFRYLKFTFWHQGGLKIHELEIQAASEAKILFLANPATNYRLYYGNNGVSMLEYDLSALYSDITTLTASLGSEVRNPQASNDYDKDGILNNQDNCLLIYNPDQKDSDGDTVGDVCDNAPQDANRNQKDTDYDGVGDIVDNCPYHKNPDQLDKDLNGIGWVCDDKDKDGIINSLDNCEPYPNRSQSDRDNNGIGDACEDIDGDSILGYQDNCLYLKNPSQKDTDKDNIGDGCDNCLLGWNPDQLDLNDDGVGDICEDDDQDGIANYRDNCPQAPNPEQEDSDGDEVGDACDNCPTMKNPDQADSNRNGIGDICDDDDGDGVINSRDNCPSFANPDQKDQNNNAIGDACEDLDKDGVINALDNCSADYNPRQGDKDKDGLGDACDEKDDRWTEKQPYLLWAVLVIVIAVVVVFAFRLLKKMGKTEKQDFKE